MLPWLGRHLGHVHASRPDGIVYYYNARLRICCLHIWAAPLQAGERKPVGPVHHVGDCRDRLPVLYCEGIQTEDAKVLHHFTEALCEARKPLLKGPSALVRLQARLELAYIDN